MDVKPTNPVLAVYTKKGIGTYTNTAYTNVGQLCDLECSMHIAVIYPSCNNMAEHTRILRLRNGTGVLFAQADPDEDLPEGRTKTLRDPWVFRRHDGSFGVLAVRMNGLEEDSAHTGEVMIFTSENLADYRFEGFLRLSTHNVADPRCHWDSERRMYKIEWKDDTGIRQAWSAQLRELQANNSAESFTIRSSRPSEMGIHDAVDGNTMSITSQEETALVNRLGIIRNTGVQIQPCHVPLGTHPSAEGLPTALCLYSDGSTHDKKVNWNLAELENIDWNVPGTHHIHGKVAQHHYPFPFIDESISDPCICFHAGVYYLTCSQLQSVVVRAADTIDSLATAKPITVYTPGSDSPETNVWAQEMHVINGTIYLFTTIGPGSWTHVQSVVLRCSGDPLDPTAWEAPQYVLRPDGTLLSRDQGISLDMTYFEVNGVHYAMWSGRKIVDEKPNRVRAYPANIYIASIDPNQPWQLTSEPQLIMSPSYGWDRCETEVDEGPYMLRHGDDIYVTISGSSTGLADLYCIGLLHAKAGTNLLNPGNWSILGYPILTKESIPNEYGPGHNAFLTDPETQDDLLIYHAVPHDKNNVGLGRHMGIRRVHWTRDGLPYLEMTGDRDLDPSFADVQTTIEVIDPK